MAEDRDAAVFNKYSYYLCFNFTYFTADEETVGFKTLNIDLLYILSCCKTFNFLIAKVPVVLHLSTHTSQDLLNIVALTVYKHLINVC